MKITTGSFSVWHDQMIIDGMKQTSQPTRSAVQLEKRLRAIR